MADDKDQIVSDFRSYVNMTAGELKEWLKTDDSNNAGWTNGNEGGESVGHDSGRQIVKILETEEGDWSEEQVKHMKKVNAYCKRHLAQEGKLAEGKSEEELRKTKSFKSLRNWGHDLLKSRNGGGGGGGGESKKRSAPEGGDDKEAKAQKKDDEENEEEDAEDGDEEDEGEDGEEGDDDEDDEEDDDEDYGEEGEDDGEDEEEDEEDEE